MLQWMGGSRRKVTTSRMSTQKRQRQYFEQRRRQQQQQATGLETFSDGANTSSQHLDNNRSLDILSLLNLPTVVQYRKSSCHSSKEDSGGNTMTENNHITKCQPIFQADKVTPVDPVEFKEARNPSVCQVETVYPMKVLSSTPGSQKRHLSGHGDRSDRIDQLKMTSEQQLSVFDLLGDDEPNDSLQEIPKHEAHVAFAVEGLGKVEMKTPVHSPQHPGRIYLYGSSPPLEATRQRQSCKNFNDLLHDLEHDTVPFCPRDTVNSFSEWNHKLPTAKENSRFNINVGFLNNSFADDEMSYGIAAEHDDIWKDENFLDEDCDITWNLNPVEVDNGSSDYWNLGSNEMSDLALEGLHLREMMATEKARGRFNISDSPTPHSRQQRSRTDDDFLYPRGTWNQKVGRGCDLRGITNQPAWFCNLTEDAGESLSLLSEESCSSSAVRGKSTKSSPSNSVARHNIRRHSNSISSPANKRGGQKYTKDRHYAKSDDLRDGKKTNGTLKFAKICNPSSPNPAQFSNTLFYDKLGPDDSFSFEGEYVSEKMNSGFSPKIWTEDHFGAYPFHDVHANVKSAFERSNHDVLHEFSPSGNFSSEKLAFCKPYSHDNSYEAPIFPTTGSRRCKRSLFMDSKFEDRPHDFFPIEGFQGDAELLHVPVEISVTKEGEKRSEKPQSDCAKVELQKDICIGSNDLSSENGQSLEASESKDNWSGCKEAQKLIPEMENQKATDFPEHAEEISSSAKIGHDFDANIDEKECHNDLQTSLLQQIASTAVTKSGVSVDDSGANERILESKGQNTSLDPSCQVMMLESYVLQLLCVQKVLKEASVHEK